MPPGARGQRFAAQDRLFAALERLEAKDTQHAAAEELTRLLKELDPSSLATLLHACGTTNAKTTTFARVHCLHLAAMCTQPDRCLHWRSMLAPPLLPKLLTLLGRALHDPDSAVRSAAAEGFGVVAAQLAAANPAGCELTAGSDANPLLTTILDALGEPGGGVQAAAAAALAAVADHLRPGLDPALLRHLLRALSNPLFLGRAELCAALARLEGGRVRGLVASSCPQLLAAMPDLLGVPPGYGGDGGGLLGALGSKGKDFALRSAAAHTLKVALAVGVGPMWTGGGGGGEGQPGWEVAVAALKTAKTDVSKPVRDAAAAALPVVQGLLAFLASGAPAAAWPETAGGLLAGEGRSKRSSVVKAAAAAAGMPGGAEDLGGGQQIAAVYPGAAAAVAAPTAAVPPPGTSCAPAATGLDAAPPGNAIPHLAAKLAAVQAQQAGMAAALTSFTAFASGTLHGVEQHLAEINARLAALAASSPASSGGSPSLWQQLAPLQQHVEAAGAGVVALRAGLDGSSGWAGQQTRPGTALWQQAPQQAPPGAGLWEQKEATRLQPQPAQTVPVQAQPAEPSQPALHVASPLRPPPTAQTSQAVPLQQVQRPPPTTAPTQHVQRPAPSAVPARPAFPKRLSSLHRSYDALEQQLHQTPGASSPASGPSSPEGTGAVGPASTTSLDSAYAQLLSGDGLAGDQNAQLRLLRALAKSGPAWEQLSAATGQRLMAALAVLLHAGAPLNRLLPWLWPLADTATAATAAATRYAPALRSQLLDALDSYLLPAGPAGAGGGSSQQGGGPGDSPGNDLSEKRDLLVTALRAVWDV
ncbi:microtubule-associated TORTIFOLIA1-like [Micractinium conductrix]|uniref:Microtubule-associated TORTIFOLIA1-like n=1 Tax=Micractinium conductrix TaxID=554055 RepID=A0A2P6VF50_9CHLO|nr:microtubule-associated TORTIFOLIA1-like [Micractinium conductrix]|eukprot:PSC72723.1 microtubule-associated TORTIFOLIA1-like [Micractinium conductrix]